MARPRKLILLVDKDEQTLSETKFMLETNGYRVISAQKEKPARLLLSVIDPNLILISGFLCLAGDLKAMAPHVPIIELREDYSEVFSAADIRLNPKSCSTAELLERIKVMSQRKRGPRPGGKGAFYPRKQVASAGAQKEGA